MVVPFHCATAETRALLMGVWKFHAPPIPDLQGPENDLTAMETLVRGKGVEDVTVLRNDGVTRTTVETALHALGLRAKPGDTIMIYYSGHGAEAQAAVRTATDGEFDQFLPLAGFDLDHQDAERFIVDKDLYSWVARYVPRTVTVFFMADTCHSGTMHRSVDPGMFHFTPRLAFRGTARGITLAARPAPRFGSVLAAADDGTSVGATRADLPNEIYFGAALDDQLALEASLPAEGAPSRGLLTYAFEQGLTTPGADGHSLAADANGDGHVSVGELADYLNAQVRLMSGQRQTASAHFPTSLDQVALFEEVGHSPAAPTTPAAPPPLPDTAVFVAGSGGSQLDGVAGIRRAPTAAAADFLWDPAAGTVVSRTGDRVADGIQSPNGIAGVIEKWRAMAALRPLASADLARLSLSPDRRGERHPPGQKLSVTLSQPHPSATPRYATVFDIGSDGTVQMLYPLATDGVGRLEAGASLPVLEAQVTAPLGADHLVAVVTPGPADALRTAIRALDGQRAAGRVVEPVRSALAGGGGASLAILDFYTGR